MPNYRRNSVPGGMHFFTVVTQDRRPILTTPLARRCLREAIAEEQQARPFTQLAVVLLPDHFHAVWLLPVGDSDYSLRMKRVKEQFTRGYLAGGRAEGATTDNRTRHGERAVWQPRFWEHTVRDEDDLERCVDYIHWNPVKHRLVEHVQGYPWSSFHTSVRAGTYPLDWGYAPPADIEGAEWD